MRTINHMYTISGAHGAPYNMFETPICSPDRAQRNPGALFKLLYGFGDDRGKLIGFLDDLLLVFTFYHDAHHRLGP